jgi:hypothetical protein
LIAVRVGRASASRVYCPASNITASCSS